MGTFKDDLEKTLEQAADSFKATIDSTDKKLADLSKLDMKPEDRAKIMPIMADYHRAKRMVRNSDISGIENLLKKYANTNNK